MHSLSASQPSIRESTTSEPNSQLITSTSNAHRSPQNNRNIPLVRFRIISSPQPCPGSTQILPAIPPPAPTPTITARNLPPAVTAAISIQLPTHLAVQAVPGLATVSSIVWSIR